MFVEDHAVAIDLVFHEGKNHETYNIGGFNEWQNIDLVKLLCQIMDSKLHREPGTSEKLITYVKDRAGHDRRYAIDAGKIKDNLGWQPVETFETGLRKTVQWYLDHTDWVSSVTSGAYRQWVDLHYGG